MVKLFNLYNLFVISALQVKLTLCLLLNELKHFFIFDSTCITDQVIGAFHVIARGQGLPALCVILLMANVLVLKAEKMQNLFLGGAVTSVVTSAVKLLQEKDV